VAFRTSSSNSWRGKRSARAWIEKRSRSRALWATASSWRAASPPADTRKSLDYFEHSVAKQPDYALALAGLAQTYAQMAGSAYDLLSPREAYPKAKAAAKRALEIDPTLSEAYTGLAWVTFVFDHDIPSASDRFQRALALDPSSPDAHQSNGIFLARLGRFDEALREVRRAQELDRCPPTST
jgi:tetratricopeptide (TPR) repeat protein